MRHSIRAFVKIVSEEIPLSEPIYEFGSLQVPGQEKFADVRVFFPGKEYVGFDLRSGPGVDKVLDVYHITEDYYGKAGTILCLDTIEHFSDPLRAFDIFFNVLKDDGILVVSSVMAFPIHNYPCDYWRFTPQGFHLLLSRFKARVVESAGKEDFPHTVVGIGFKKTTPDLSRFIERLKTWKESLKNTHK